MKDTHFIVPSAKLRQKAIIYECKRSKVKGAKKKFYAKRWQSHQMHPKVFSAGGGILSYSDAGMYGTAEDYARFCQMLLNGGRAPCGRQVLQKKTVRMFFKDSLVPFAGR